MNRTGTAAAAAADWAAAEAAFRAALDSLDDERAEVPRPVDGLTDDDARLAVIQGNLAVVLLEQGAIDEARELLEEALRIRRVLFGEGDPAVAESLNNLAELTRRAGDPVRARAMHEEALALRRALLPDGHPDIAESLNNLGVTLHGLGETEAAAALLDESLAIRRERLGPAHRASLETAASRAAVAFDAHQPEAAEAALRGAVAAMDKTAASQGGIAAELLRALVESALLQGESAHAALLCEEHLSEVGQPPDPPLAELIGTCVRALGQAGAAERAIALAEAGLAAFDPAAADAVPVEIELRWSLAEARSMAGDLVTAEATLGEVVALLEEAADPRLVTALNNRGSIRFERGLPLDALADLETALEWLNGAGDQTLLQDVLGNYAIVLRGLDRNDEALAAENRLLELVAGD